MRFKRGLCFRVARWIGVGLAGLALSWMAWADAVSTTVVRGTVYLANGAAGSGMLQLSWPAFSTADSHAVAAGRLNVVIGTDGSVSVSLAPNLGSMPAGLYYTAVYHLSDGTTSTEYWVVPPGGPVSIAQVRSQVMPAAQAVQAVSKAYVDQAIQSINQGSLTSTGGALTGPLYLNGDPTQELQAADKRYVDAAVAVAVPLAGTAGQIAYYTGDGTVLGGTNAVPIAAGGTGASTAAGALTALGGASLGTTAGQSFAGPIFAPSVNASVNDSINVKAAPYNAKCDGATDDRAALQSALNDALALGKPVEFPIGVCKTHRLLWKGQSLFGKGPALSSVKGFPGEDVFSNDDVATAFPVRAVIRDLQIIVDATADASAAPNYMNAAGQTVVEGSGSFPNRVAGTSSGSATGGVNAPAVVLADAPVIGPVLFGTGASGVNYGTTTVGSKVISIPGINTLNQDQKYVIGSQITVNGAGASGGVLHSTITAVTNSSITMADAAQTATTAASGNWGDPGWINPPWYVGNCGIAIVRSNGNASVSNVNDWLFKNVIFTGLDSSGQSHKSRTCGFFTQAAPYNFQWENVDFQNLGYGYVEAKESVNPVAIWRPDTTSFKDINFKNNQIQGVFLNGTHRSFTGISNYTGNNPWMMGEYWFTVNDYGSATVTRYYAECWSNNSGEYSRFGLTQVQIVGGNMGSCSSSTNGGLYVRWDASNSTVDATFPSLVIKGSNNTFRHSSTSTPIPYTDYGTGNKLETISYVNGSMTGLWQNRVREALNKMDAGFLLAGNSTTPFTSGNDLIVPCEQFNFAFINNGSTPQGCVNDPTGMEPTQSYFHATPAYYAAGSLLMGINTGGTFGSGPLGKYWYVGDRVPQAKVNLVVMGRCDVACTQNYGVTEYTTSGTNAGNRGTANLTFGTTWTTQTLAVDLSAATPGNSLRLTVSGLYGSGNTYFDLAYVAFQPINSDVIAAASAQAAANMLSATNSWTAANTFTGKEVVSTTTVSTNAGQRAAFVASALRPGYLYYASGQGTDQKYWRTEANGTAWYLNSANDAYTSGVNAMTVNRGTGTAIGTIVFGGTQVQLPTTSTVGGSQIATVQTGTTASIGGSALTAGACASGTATVTGATTAMAVEATPSAYPGDAMAWKGYVSSSNVVTVKVCAIAAGTPTASAYNVRVIQ
jgi:hypothetical protein